MPEIASREHLQHLFPLVSRALHDAGASWSDVERIAVTAGPGLIGALLVGVAGAQGLAYGLGIPIVPVNHLEGHIFSPYLQRDGAVWVVYPKGRPEISEVDVIRAGVEQGLVDNKVVRFSDTHTALRFVIPKARR